MDKPYRCILCKTPTEPFGHDFVNSEPCCPKCKLSGVNILPLVYIHLYFPDVDGPILGTAGVCYRVACKPKARNPRGVPCSTQAITVTCPECQKTRDYQEAKVSQEDAQNELVLS